jgi:hypothetical protein
VLHPLSMTCSAMLPNSFYFDLHSVDGLSLPAVLDCHRP